MYYRIKIYIKNKRFAKFKFNVDSKYLSYIIEALDNDELKFLQVDTLILDKREIKYIMFKEMEKK